MSPDERINESLLLKERWNLIQSDIERKSKIQGTEIFANKKLVRQLSNFKFKYSFSRSSEPKFTSDPTLTIESNDPSLDVNDSHSNLLNLLSQPVQICVSNIRSIMNKLSNFQSFVYSNPLKSTV